MDSKSQQKVMDAGFTILRIDDTPTPRIKFKDDTQREWKTFEKFKTKAERDRRFTELMKWNKVIND